jgi:nitrogen fixation NifU-like protein
MSTVRAGIDKAMWALYTAPENRYPWNENSMHDNNEDFWQSHSMKFLEMAFRTDRQERLQHADGYGVKTGDCGDTIEFFLMLAGDRIEAISYAVSGCMFTNACANAVIELVQGESLDAAWELNPEDISDFLQSLPADHFHCAELAVGTLYLALADAREKQKSPWKKMYR